MTIRSRSTPPRCCASDRRRRAVRRILAPRLGRARSDCGSLRLGPRVSSGRRGASEHAVRRLRHEYRYRRCGGPRLEACRCRCGLGRTGTARNVRNRTPPGCATQRPSSHRELRRRPQAPNRSAIASATPDGDRARAELRAKLVASQSRQFLTDGTALGYRYDGSPICIPTVRKRFPIRSSSITRTPCPVRARRTRSSPMGARSSTYSAGASCC